MLGREVSLRFRCVDVGRAAVGRVPVLFVEGKALVLAFFLDGGGSDGAWDGQREKKKEKCQG